MKFRPYVKEDYVELRALYQQSDHFNFDSVTDAEENIQRKIDKDPDSIIVAEEDGRIFGSVSIIEDGRMAILFRIAAHLEYQDRSTLLHDMVDAAENILKDRGFEEVHCLAPVTHKKVKQERENLGFTPGTNYKWYWKKLT